MNIDDQREAVDILAKLDFATEIAVKAGTSVTIPGDQMLLVLRYVEHVVSAFNERNTALNSAGEWIANAKIAVEPGWEGSQSHILRTIEAALEGGDA